MRAPYKLTKQPFMTSRMIVLWTLINLHTFHAKGQELGFKVFSSHALWILEDCVFVVQVKELGEIETRVKEALVKKDIIIATLREQLFAAHKQIQSTESLLQEEHNALISE